MGLIYKITCKVNGKVYVGQTTKTLTARWCKHIYDSKERRCAIHNAIRKYRPENFEIEELQKCPDTDLNDREVFWVRTLSSHEKDRGYNLTLGGQEASVASVREKLSEMRKGEDNPFYGRHHSEETRARMSRVRKGRPATNKGKKHSPEQIAKMAESARRSWERRRALELV